MRENRESHQAVRLARLNPVNRPLFQYTMSLTLFVKENISLKWTENCSSATTFKMRTSCSSAALAEIRIDRYLLLLKWELLGACSCWNENWSLSAHAEMGVARRLLLQKWQTLVGCCCWNDNYSSAATAEMRTVRRLPAASSASSELSEGLHHLQCNWFLLFFLLTCRHCGTSCLVRGRG